MGVVKRRQLKRSSLSDAMTKKGRQIFSRRVTTAVAALGDTNPSDATGSVRKVGSQKDQTFAWINAESKTASREALSGTETIIATFSS